MPSMTRRLLRIFCVVGIAASIGMTVVAQRGMFELNTPKGSISLGGTGIVFDNRPSVRQTGFHRYPSWSVNDLFQPPLWLTSGSGDLVGRLPWWLLLAIWGFLTVVIWRLTRLKAKQGFPIEPTQKTAHDPASESSPEH